MELFYPGWSTFGFYLIQTPSTIRDSFRTEYLGSPGSVLHPRAKGMVNNESLLRQVEAIRPRVSQEET